MQRDNSLSSSSVSLDVIFGLLATDGGRGAGGGAPEPWFDDRDVSFEFERGEPLRCGRALTIKFAQKGLRKA